MAFAKNNTNNPEKPPPQHGQGKDRSFTFTNSPVAHSPAKHTPTPPIYPKLPAEANTPLSQTPNSRFIGVTLPSLSAGFPIQATNQTRFLGVLFRTSFVSGSFCTGDSLLCSRPLALSSLPPATPFPFTPWGKQFCRMLPNSLQNESESKAKARKQIKLSCN